MPARLPGSTSELVEKLVEEYPHLAHAESVVLTRTDVTEDARILTNSATGAACPNSTYSKNSEATASIALTVPGSGSNNGCSRLYFEWDISSIPDTATIKFVSFGVHADPVSQAGTSTCDMTQISNQPSANDATTLWTDIGDGNTYVSGSDICDVDIYTSGAHQLDLGSDAVTDLGNLLASDWFGLGVKMTDEAREAGAKTSNFWMADQIDTVLNPTLVVFYTTSGQAADDNGFAIAYADGGSSTDAPRFKEWNPSTRTYSSEVTLPATGSAIRNTWIQYSSQTTTTIVVMSLSTDGTLNLFRCTGTCTTGGNWSLVSADFADVGAPVSTQYSTYADMKFEESTGDLLIVYDKALTEVNDFYYRIYDSGGTMGSENGFDLQGGGADAENLNYFELAAKGSAQEITMVVLDDTGGDAIALVWDGSSWGNQLTITTSLGTTAGDRKGGAVAYEKDSGNAMVFAYSGADSISYARWSGSWSGVSTTDPNSGLGSNDAYAMKAVQEPASGSNKVILCVEDDLSDVACVVFDGGTVGTWRIATQAAHTPSNNGDAFAFVFDSGASTGTFFYSNGPNVSMAYRTWNGTHLGDEVYLGHPTVGFGFKGATSVNSSDLVDALLVELTSDATPSLGSIVVSSDGEVAYQGSATISSNTIAEYTMSFSIAQEPVASTVTQPISITFATGTNDMQTEGVSATITCTGGGGTHDGNPASQDFTCDPSVTVTVALPASATLRYLFSDGTASKNFSSCSSGTCSTESYTGVKAQWNIPSISFKTSTATSLNTAVSSFTLTDAGSTAHTSISSTWVQAGTATLSSVTWNAINVTPSPATVSITSASAISVNTAVVENTSPSFQVGTGGGTISGLSWDATLRQLSFTSTASGTVDTVIDYDTFTQTHNQMVTIDGTTHTDLTDNTTSGILTINDYSAGTNSFVAQFSSNTSGGGGGGSFPTGSVVPGGGGGSQPAPTVGNGLFTVTVTSDTGDQVTKIKVEPGERGRGHMKVKVTGTTKIVITEVKFTKTVKDNVGQQVKELVPYIHVDGQLPIGKTLAPGQQEIEIDLPIVVDLPPDDSGEPQDVTAEIDLTNGPSEAEVTAPIEINGGVASELNLPEYEGLPPVITENLDGPPLYSPTWNLAFLVALAIIIAIVVASLKKKKALLIKR